MMLNPRPVLCDNLEEWDGEEVEEVQEGGVLDIHLILIRCMEKVTHIVK